MSASAGYRPRAADELLITQIALECHTIKGFTGFFPAAKGLCGFGLPMPEDMILIVSGILASHEVTHFWGVTGTCQSGYITRIKLSRYQ